MQRVCCGIETEILNINSIDLTGRPVLCLTTLTAADRLSIYDVHRTGDANSKGLRNKNLSSATRTV